MNQKLFYGTFVVLITLFLSLGGDVLERDFKNFEKGIEEISEIIKEVESVESQEEQQKQEKDEAKTIEHDEITLGQITPNINTNVQIEKELKTDETFYFVQSVVDGDTIKIEIDGKVETLRLIGMNTPETVDPRRPVQCFGKEASLKLKSLLPEGSNVKIVADDTQTDVDKNGRLLRYVEVDGYDVGAKMISEGYAYQYLYRYPYVRHIEYVQLEKDAKASGKGLWSACK